MILHTALLLAAALLLANLPFVIRPTMFRSATGGSADFAVRLLEWFLCLILTGVLAWLLETRSAPLQQQHWQFYATAVCMYVVFAFPGFVYRYLWRKPGL